VEKLAEALRVERRSMPTRPTEASRQRRLEAKRRRAALKRNRATPADE
jgi:ribosome-associated protein